MHHVYILKLKTGKHYTGMTKDINRRLKEHINGKSISTKYYRPLQLTFLTSSHDKFTARKLEVHIKNFTARKFLISNRFDKKYSDMSKYPDILRFLIDFEFKAIMENDHIIINLPEHVT